MKTIATLGPVGTFSDIATFKYLGEVSGECEVKYFASIKLALNTIGKECDIAVLPIENFSEGFIPILLDALAKKDTHLYITYEVRIPVNFSFVSNSPSIGNINKIFSQFVANGQCSEFLTTLGNFNLITTQSNIQSLELLKLELSAAGAIVPAHAIKNGDFPLVIGNVNDFPDNETRFIAISSTRNKCNLDIYYECKTSLVIYGDKDYPGLLGDILVAFSTRGINISSLVSRPSMAKFGQYDFFVDVIGNESSPLLKEAISEVATICSVKSLGTYRIASDRK